MAGRVTVKNIAQITGVSIGTVDRVINNRGKVNPETEEKILKAIHETGFIPNRAARFLTQKNRKTMALIYPTSPKFFWGAFRKGTSVAEKELRDMGMDIVRYEIEGLALESEISIALETIDTANIDIIALFPCNTPSIIEKLKKLAAGGKKIITFNNDLDNHQLRSFFVGTDAYQCGRIVAEMLGKMLRRKGNILILNSNDEFLSEYNLRLKGLYDGISEKFPEVNVAATYRYNAKNFYKHRKIICEMIEEYHIDAIHDLNVSSLRKMCTFLEETGKSADIILSGYELDPALVDMLRKGVVDFIIDQDAYQQGYMVVKHVYDFIMQNKLPADAKINIPSRIVLCENAMDFKIYD
ncbi:MAG: substrate-binding domain-containing protein [Clostridiaceae bacterium]|nr:substrate-binding domain-containing protein [Clostridiaceae bacterium]